MKLKLVIIGLFIIVGQTSSQTPKLYIHLVSHNEPTDSLQQTFKYQQAKSNVVQLAGIVDSKNAKWNLQTSDGFVFGARQDEIISGSNVFRTLAGAPFSDNIEIDPRSKNFPGRNIADQWYLLDSIGANPTKTVGGFIYYVCPPASNSLIDWWQYTDTVTGLYYGNKIKFNLLSGAGSLSPHCNDLNDFGIFKPDTTTNFYQHNSQRNLWCIGTGCATVLDSLSDEQAIIDLIQGQVDSIQNGFWPSNKFYVTRIMTNQREYGPLFFQKISKVIDSLNLIPNSQLQWAKISEAFTDFQSWQIQSGLDHSQWQCGQTTTSLNEITEKEEYSIYPNPTNGNFAIDFNDELIHEVYIFNALGLLIESVSIKNIGVIDLSGLGNGLYFIRTKQGQLKVLLKQ